MIARIVRDGEVVHEQQAFEEASGFGPMYGVTIRGGLVNEGFEVRDGDTIYFVPEPEDA